MNPIHYAFRSIVFWVGDTKWTSSFPYFSWDREEPYIDLNEVDYAKTFLQKGDIILHREKKCWSNAAIPGTMIHAGIYVGDGQVVEAISEGVVKRNAGHILHSDYAIILRPNFDNQITQQAAINEAIDWANRIINFPYDYLFQFNSDEDQKKLKERGILAAASLGWKIFKIIRTILNIKSDKDGIKFCCTEIPHFCYYQFLDQLNVHRRKNITFLTKLISILNIRTGEYVVDADMYIKANFKIVWCNKLFTPEWAESMKSDKKCLEKIKVYWAKK
jgi:hypothetical protein